jgi:hypothetical protein
MRSFTTKTPKTGTFRDIPLAWIMSCVAIQPWGVMLPVARGEYMFGVIETPTTPETWAGVRHVIRW